MHKLSGAETFTLCSPVHFVWRSLMSQSRSWKKHSKLKNLCPVYGLKKNYPHRAFASLFSLLVWLPSLIPKFLSGNICNPLPKEVTYPPPPPWEFQDKIQIHNTKVLWEGVSAVLRHSTTQTCHFSDNPEKVVGLLNLKMIFCPLVRHPTSPTSHFSDKVSEHLLCNVFVFIIITGI